MIFVEGILALGGLLSTIGFGRAMAAIAAFLDGVGEVTALTAEAAATAALEAYPHVRRAVFIALGAIGIAAALIGIGITLNTPLPIFLGGMVIWLVLVTFFSTAWVLTRAVALVNSVSETAATWIVGGVKRVLSTAGLATPLAGAVTLLPIAKFDEEVRAARRATYTTLWLVIAVLLVFPYWSTTLVLMPALAGLYILAGALAREYAFDTKPFWHAIWKIAIPVASVALVVKFLLPNTAGVIHERTAHFDEWLRCGIESIGPGVDSEECKQRALRSLAKDMDKSFTRGERALKRFAVRGVTPVSSADDAKLGPEDAQAPVGVPPTPPSP